jgi:hypothetical protein
MHLWLQNTEHTWKRIVDGQPITAIDGFISILSVPDGTYQVEWWDTYKTSSPVFQTETVEASRGKLDLNLPAPLSSDVAVQIKRISGSNATPTPVGTLTPTASPTVTPLATPTVMPAPSKTPTEAAFCLGTGIVSALLVPSVAIYLYRNRAAFSKRSRKARSPHSSSGKNQYTNRWNGK